MPGDAQNITHLEPHYGNRRDSNPKVFFQFRFSIHPAALAPDFPQEHSS
jgi:hypothetical protein